MRVIVVREIKSGNILGIFSNSVLASEFISSMLPEDFSGGFTGYSKTDFYLDEGVTDRH